ncbi:NAD(P)/FAD-dependent oxidoreductase [Salinicoccus sp. YB14-2]|uniref:NAD(P)/FAD-dependent oxidoreductase n=1 Tax=Salinicoccus sp. YB14-2 TaxID=1572701 RepID=UPI00068C64DC|nr:NAD(P)/FAD-dependent oxidoreductase [Salinicoccus sp. YB14-2]
MFDIIVVGGGVSGLMASYAASKDGKKVLLIEKNKKLGQKLLISGGGRCNVTNRLPYEEIISHIPGNGKFLYGPFSTFDNESIIDFVQTRGVNLKEEDHGRMFPVTDKAMDVLNVFLKELDDNKVTIRYSTIVDKILVVDDTVTGVRLNDGEIIRASNVIITTGGKSVPNTGSTGDGHRFATEAGHNITELFPTEVPITSSEPFIKTGSLKGLSLSNVALSVLRKNGKPRITHQMDMIFTHFGVSGPAALRCSQFIFKEQKSQKRNDISMMIDFYPDVKKGTLQQTLDGFIKESPNKSIRNILKGMMQDRLAEFLIEFNGIAGDATSHHLKNEDKQKIVEFLKGFTFKVDGTQSIEKAFVTGGGVNLKEITPQTMESRMVEGLYFAGEVLDIHGYTGGYNITSALVTGYVAGHSAGMK